MFLTAFDVSEHKSVWIRVSYPVTNCCIQINGMHDEAMRDLVDDFDMNILVAFLCSGMMCQHCRHDKQVRASISWCQWTSKLPNNAISPMAQTIATTNDTQIFCPWLWTCHPPHRHFSLEKKHWKFYSKLLQITAKISILTQISQSKTNDFCLHTIVLSCQFQTALLSHHWMDMDRNNAVACYVDWLLLWVMVRFVAPGIGFFSQSMCLQQTKPMTLLVIAPFHISHNVEENQSKSVSQCSMSLKCQKTQETWSCESELEVHAKRDKMMLKRLEWHHHPLLRISVGKMKREALERKSV